jgi:hypothetical protein
MKGVYKFIIFSIVLMVGSGVLYAQNYKIKQSTSISGQNISSTIYVKGSRKRTESSGMMGVGADVATIEQCDLKRNVKVNDSKKQYFVEPFDTTSDEAAPRTAKTPTPNPGTVVKGGTLTLSSSIIDTGERKQMFGLTARHIKTSMKMESSPDACSQTNMQMETDGWYVDLPQFSCPVNGSSSTIPYQRPARSGCQDRTIVKETGGGKLGFPLQVTQIMNSGEGGGFTQTIETLEFSKAILDDALFEVPATYTLVRSTSDLYGRPDYSAMMRGGQDAGEARPQPPVSNPNRNVTGQNPTLQNKRPGVIRIGVLTPTNRSTENISTTSLQSYLAQKLTVGNTEGITVGSEDEARSAGCDFVLSSDFSKFKQSTASKIGGLFGKVTNTDSSASRNYDAQVDFKLVSLKTGQPVLQNKAAAKAEGDANHVAEGVLAQEAMAVLAAAK